MGCENCDRTTGEFIRTAYGDILCEDCWDDYICTEAGRLEYFIGFCKGDYRPDEFDADFVYETVKSWKLYCSMLDFTPQQRFELEEKARELGIL